MIFKNAPEQKQISATDSIGYAQLFGLNARIAYQHLGKTLVGVYLDNGDNYIQQPLSVLAFSADKSISKHFILFIKLNNLLNTDTTVVLHNFQNYKEVTKGTYLLGVRYNYFINSN
jgi:hypothetical protein